MSPHADVAHRMPSAAHIHRSQRRAAARPPLAVFVPLLTLRQHQTLGHHSLIAHAIQAATPPPFGRMSSAPPNIEKGGAHHNRPPRPLQSAPRLSATPTTSDEQLPPYSDANRRLSAANLVPLKHDPVSSPSKSATPVTPTSPSSAIGRPRPSRPSMAAPVLDLPPSIKPAVKAHEPYEQARAKKPPRPSDEAPEPRAEEEEKVGRGKATRLTPAAMAADKTPPSSPPASADRSTDQLLPFDEPDTDFVSACDTNDA